MLQRYSALSKSDIGLGCLTDVELDRLKEFIKSGDRKYLARAISLCEDSPLVAARVLSHFGANAKKYTTRIGLTGPPGAGKSTLVSKLIVQIAQAESKIGAVLVDPTSPISKGAVLGDRIRLGKETLSENVYIRSLASRGSLGGLSVSASAAVRLIEHWGAKDIVIETVGIGQQGTDIQWLADVVLLVLSPGVGDSIQTMKAGVFETADAYIINKSDLVGANNLALMIETELLSTEGTHPKVFMTNAKTGEGVDELVAWIQEFGAKSDAETNSSKERKRISRELFFLTESLIIEHMTRDAGVVAEVQALAEQVVEEKLDIFSAALKISECLIQQK